MKINYTMWGTGLTGGTRVLIEIIARLSKKHEVTITTLGSPEENKWTSSIDQKRAVYVKRSWFFQGLKSYAVSRLLDSLHLRSFSYRDIRALAKSTPDCDINVATFAFTAPAVFETSARHKFYHLQHYEPLLFDNPTVSSFIRRVYELPLEKFVNSLWLKEQMERIHGETLEVVNPAIDHSVFYPRKRAASEGKNKIRIVSLGKNARWKGFPEALEAVETVRHEGYDVELVAFGSIRPLYRSKVPFTFVKSPSDEGLAELYRSADIVLSSSWYESFPLPPLEAMACGTPVVTTRYGTEDYCFHEKNSLVVPPRDPKAIADALIRLIEDESLREQFRKEGPKTARKFTWEKTVRKVEKIFRRAVNS